MSAVSGIAQAQSVALLGVDATVVDIEAWTGSGLPRTTMVGLPDAALTQAKERCRAAVLSAGYAWPAQVLTINLTPASLPKTGSHYDLGIAAAVLATQGVLAASSLRGIILLGELGLDGVVHPVRGVLTALLGARRRGAEQAVVPTSQLREARLVEGMTVRGVNTLTDVVAVLRGGDGVTPPPVVVTGDATAAGPDLADVVGLTAARWAVEVAAAGRHHLCLHGPPGVGKTLLASCLPGILPALCPSEALEVAALHSLADASIEALPVRPPFSAPHHTASLASLIGGGARIARPGAISWAHRGVLFLDEAPEFSGQALEALRIPLESGEVILGRSESTIRYPARFQLVLAANPCPCGLASTPQSTCTCTPMAIRRYATRLSGPILDRVDIQTQVLPLKQSLLTGLGGEPERSEVVAHRVGQARSRQAHRLSATPWSTNAEVPGAHLRKRLPVPLGMEAVDHAVAAGLLTARGVDKVIRVAWTVADLAGADRPTSDHVFAALALRQGQSR
ncbi:MAG: YifB family Mg chelatase-like AAA ATPase [Propionibacteriaceae bacterium]|jgi:magnesium chelatase family protein|nr:YifB family Mg chelatase-like AAA ATPase [Propionibacteriaceae bacterium]